MNFVKLISTSFKQGKLYPKFLRYGLNDVQECKQSAPFGIDSNPIKDMVAVYSGTDVSGENIIIGYVNADCLAQVGETRLFSTSETGELKIYAWLKNDGTIEFGGNVGHLTRFEQVLSAYNEVNNKLNALVSAFNAHSHATAGTGPPVPPTPIPGSIPAQPSTGDISGAKIDELKTL